MNYKVAECVQICKLAEHHCVERLIKKKLLSLVNHHLPNTYPSWWETERGQ